MPARLSLHIGVNTYIAGIRSLDYCGHDAAAVASALNARREGFDSVQSKVLAGIDDAVGAIPPTRSNIVTAVMELCRSGAPDDTLIFQFAGHGAITGDGRMHLLPSDCAGGPALQETSIAWSWIIEQLDQAKAMRRILMIDACHSGAGRDVGGTGATKASAKMSQELASGRGYVCLSACAGGQLALELPDLRHGVFSYYVKAGLLGAADPLRRGVISVDSLFKYVTDRTKQHAARHGGEQTPTLISRVDAPLDRFILTAAPLDGPIRRVAVLSEVPTTASFVSTCIRCASPGSEAETFQDLSEALAKARAGFDFDVVYIDVENKYQRVKQFIDLVRRTYPVVPFVLIGRRGPFLDRLSQEDRRRFSEYFFFDTEGPVFYAADAIAETLAQAEWDIKERYGEKNERRSRHLAPGRQHRGKRTTRRRT